MLFEIVQFHGPKCWKKIASLLGPVRTDVQCLHRYNKVLKVSFESASAVSLSPHCCLVYVCILAWPAEGIVE